jgi:hypothetical protein
MLTQPPQTCQTRVVMLPHGSQFGPTFVHPTLYSPYYSHVEYTLTLFPLIPSPPIFAPSKFYPLLSFTDPNIYTVKNPQHKTELLPPPQSITATMPTHKSKPRAITNDISGTPFPPSTTVSLRKSPPKNIQLFVFPLAKILQMFPPADAPYPWYGRHPSNPITILSCKKNGSISCPSRNSQMTKNLCSCSNSIGRISDKTLSTRGSNPTPAKSDLFFIFN